MNWQGLLTTDLKSDLAIGVTVTGFTGILKFLSPLKYKNKEITNMIISVYFINVTYKAINIRIDPQLSPPSFDWHLLKHELGADF